MGAQHSRLQKRSLRRRSSLHNLFNATTTAKPAPYEEVTQPKLKASMQALSKGVDLGSAEALVDETLCLPLDLQQVHQQLNEDLKTRGGQDSAQKRPLLPQSSFELRPASPSVLDSHPGCRRTDHSAASVGELEEELSSHLQFKTTISRSNRCSRGRRTCSTQSIPSSSLCPNPYSSTLSRHSRRSMNPDEARDSPPSLTSSSSRHSSSVGSIRSLSLPPSRHPSRMSGILADAPSRDSILGPAIALCEELLNQNLESLLSAQGVNTEIRRAGDGD